MGLASEDEFESTPNLERIKLWVEALESRAFLQTTNQLRSEKMSDGTFRYCCLGIATQVYAEACNVPNVWWKDHDPKEGDDFSYLPVEVSQWFGFEEVDPSIAMAPVGDGSDGEAPELRMHTASELNDDKGYTFAQIAALVRTRFGLDPAPETDNDATPAAE